jgi:hypothetical protein
MNPFLIPCLLAFFHENSFHAMLRGKEQNYHTELMPVYMDVPCHYLKIMDVLCIQLQ